MFSPFFLKKKRNCVPFHFFLFCFLLAFFFFFSFLFFSFFKGFFFIFGQAKGTARHGRSRHPPTKVFEFCEVNLATLKVAMNILPNIIVVLK